MTVFRNAKPAVNEEVKRLEAALESLAQLRINNRLNAEQWHLQSAALIKDAAIRATVVAAGGENQTTFRHWGKAGNQLRREYASLMEFGDRISSGELSEKQILYQSRLQARKLSPIFSEQDLLSRAIVKGHNVGWRRVDPTSQHCDLCPAYATNGYIRLEDIVPIGVACPCGGNCNCTVATRYDPRFDQENLAQLVNSKQEQLHSEELTLAKVEQTFFRRRSQTAA